jgi:hypothetical protein
MARPRSSTIWKKNPGQRDVDWFLEKQELVSDEERFYDKMDIELADKNRITVYFDITEFFGIY